MKKALSLILASFMLLSLAACGKKEAAQAPAESTQQSAPAAESTASDSPARPLRLLFLTVPAAARMCGPALPPTT